MRRFRWISRPCGEGWASRPRRAAFATTTARRSPACGARSWPAGADGRGAQRARRGVLRQARESRAARAARRRSTLNSRSTARATKLRRNGARGHSKKRRAVQDKPTTREMGAMAYLVPAEFVTKMVDAGESKVFMSARDTLIRAFMAGALLALAAVFAVSITVETSSPLLGAVLFPVGFCMLYLLGYDLLTGVFVLSPLALVDKRPGVTLGGVLRNWGLVFVGNFAGALLVALLMAFVFTF